MTEASSTSYVLRSVYMYSLQPHHSQIYTDRQNGFPTYV